MRRRGPVVVNTRRGPGLVGTMARTAVIAGTATATVGATKAIMGGGSQKQAAAAQQQDIADLQAQQADLATQQAALAQQAAATPDPNSLEYQAAEIQKLQVMKDQGLITDEEFQAKKRQILGI